VTEKEKSAKSLVVGGVIIAYQKDKQEKMWTSEVLTLTGREPHDTGLLEGAKKRVPEWR